MHKEYHKYNAQSRRYKRHPRMFDKMCGTTLIPSREPLKAPVPLLGKTETPTFVAAEVVNVGFLGTQ